MLRNRTDSLHEASALLVLLLVSYEAKRGEEISGICSVEWMSRAVDCLKPNIAFTGISYLGNQPTLIVISDLRLLWVGGIFACWYNDSFWIFGPVSLARSAGMGLLLGAVY